MWHRQRVLWRKCGLGPVRGCLPVTLCRSPGGIGRDIGLGGEVPPEKCPEMRVLVGHSYS